jgi:hypothetical protein
MSVMPVRANQQRPGPPDELTPPQAELWRAVVASSPEGWFREGDVLLAAFCRHSVSANELARLIDSYGAVPDDLRSFGRLLAMRERETRMLSSLATKLRLTPQARMHPRSAGRAFDNVSTGPKPWEYSGRP